MKLQGRSCEEFRGRTRARRSAMSSNITNWQSFLEFKVAVPEPPNAGFDVTVYGPIFIAAVVVFIVLSLLVVIVHRRFRK